MFSFVPTTAQPLPYTKSEHFHFRVYVCVWCVCVCMCVCMCVLFGGSLMLRMRGVACEGSWCALKGTMDDYVRRAVQVFRECAAVPCLSSATVACLGDVRFEVLSKWSQRELERGRKVGFRRSFVLEKRGQRLEKIVCSTSLSEASNE